MQLGKILKEIDLKIAGSMGKKREGLLEAENIIRKHLSSENAAEIKRSPRDNDGWISVEERLPEEKRANYEVTFINECGYEEHGFAQWYDGEFHIPAVVIAWRDHLEPYRPETKAKKPNWREDMLRKFDRRSGQ